jgi:hypothetical protein
MTSSSPRDASSTAAQEPSPTAPPLPLTALPPPLATDASSHPFISSGRMEAGDGASGVATTAPAQFFFFFQNPITCVEFLIMDYGLWINRFIL